jgi:hypothetical protein
MENVFKIIFINGDKLYEIYATGLEQSSMFGFIEVEGIIFGEQSSVLVDPSEEKLKSEFGNVSRTYIPMHSIIRIDEVPKQGTAKIHNTNGNVTQFPGGYLNNMKSRPRESKD